MFGNPSGFNELIVQREMFKVELFLNGLPCRIMESGPTSRGYEIVFENPFLAQSPPENSVRPFLEEADFKLSVTTLHPRVEHFLSVHLAYPANQARIQFAFGEVGIRNVSVVHFFTSKAPRIDLAHSADGRLRRISATVRGPRWIFPDEGVVFVWE